MEYLEMQQISFCSYLLLLHPRTQQQLKKHMQHDTVCKAVLSYIGFIYTFYLQIFVSKSSLYTFLNSRTTTPVTHTL